MTEHCSNCGELTCGKMRIEARKGCRYPFCTNCFNLFQHLPNKEIRRILKLNKRSGFALKQRGNGILTNF